MDSNEYTTKRSQLLEKCQSVGFDMELQIQCDCLNSLDTQARAFDKYKEALATFNVDQAKWMKFYNDNKHLMTQYENLEKQLAGKQMEAHYTWLGGKTCQDYDKSFTEIPIAPGVYHCFYNPDYIRHQLLKWRITNKLPDLVYKPPTVAPFSPGKIMCCLESMKNISNTGTIEFDNIKQNCVAEIQRNIESGGATESPESDASISTPSAPISSVLPTNDVPSSTTLWMVLGIFGGCLVVLVAFGMYRRYASGEDGSTSDDGGAATE